MLLTSPEQRRRQLERRVPQRNCERYNVVVFYVDHNERWGRQLVVQWRHDVMAKGL